MPQRSPARTWRGVAAVLGACIAPLGWTGEDAFPWLERMNEALVSRNYDGTFFHVRDGRVETLRIIHRVEDGAVHERLISLDGSGREFIRAGNELTCILPDQRTVLVERTATQAPLLGNLPRFDATTASYYEVDAAEPTRLMGRDARLVVVRPRDAYRYGYRLWIDEKTAMPLKTQLCDGSGRVIEQIVFASLTLPSRIPDAAFQSQTATAGFRWLRHDGLASGALVAGGAPAVASLPVGPTSAWAASRLPPGFRLTQRSEQRLPGIDRPVSHLVYSDGVASVSVFIQSSAAADGSTTVAGTTQIGPSAAYSTRLDGHVITAVGEVPAGTVRFIATQVRPQPAAVLATSPSPASAPSAAAATRPERNPALQSPPRSPADEPGAGDARRRLPVPALAPGAPPPPEPRR